MRDAAIVSITVMGQTLTKDHMSVIINDGHRRLMPKEKIYHMVVSMVPSLAQRTSALLRDDRSFLVLIEDEKILELTIDEAAKKREIDERAHDEMRPSSRTVLDAMRNERALQGGSSIERRNFQKHDEYIRKLSDLERPSNRDSSIRRKR